MARYRTYLHGQVRELLTPLRRDQLPVLRLLLPGHQQPEIHNNKGADDWGSVELMALTRELQPGIVINDRLDIPGDLVTPEQYQPSRADEAGRRAGRLGGVPDDQRQLGLRPRQHAVQDPGDAGPDARRRGEQGRKPAVQHRPDRPGQLRPGVGRDPGRAGRVDERCTDARSTAPGRASFAPPPDCRYTQRGDRLYLHLFAWPFEHVHLPGLAGKVAYAQLLERRLRDRLHRQRSRRPGPEHHDGRAAGGHLDADVAHPPARGRRAGRRALP